MHASTTDGIDIIRPSYYYYNMRIVHIGTTKNEKRRKNLTKE